MDSYTTDVLNRAPTASDTQVGSLVSDQVPNKMGENSNYKKIQWDIR